MTEEQKYKEADARTEREKNKIHKLLFHDVGVSPDRWRPFDILYVRERQLLFEELQVSGIMRRGVQRLTSIRHVESSLKEASLHQSMR
jgi:hypothetical protein